jgi:hypothetical protein
MSGSELLPCKLTPNPISRVANPCAVSGQARREASASLYASIWQPLICGVP